MHSCTRNGGGRPISRLTHDRGRFGEAERTAALGMHHDLAAGGELMNAVAVLAAEIHERPFAIRLNLGQKGLHQLSPALTALGELVLKRPCSPAIRQEFQSRAGSRHGGLDDGGGMLLDESFEINRIASPKLQSPKI